MQINIDNFSPEDRNGIECWFVLLKIKKHQQYHIEPNKVQYQIYSPADLAGEEMPFEIEESKIINELQEMRAITIHSAENVESWSTPLPELPKLKINKSMVMIYDLEILLPRFNKLYGEYKEKWQKVTKVLVKRNKEFDKKRMSEEIIRFIRTKKFGRKEKLLLKLLSDFQPYDTKELKKKIKTKALIQLKKKVNQKLSKTNITIRTNRGGGYNPSFYQLKFLTNRKKLI